MGCHESTCAFTIRRVTRYLHTMYPITDPEKNREFCEALGLEFRRDMDIVETERRSRPRRRPRIRDGAESFA